MRKVARTNSRAPTAFELRLYALCKCIPAGRVATYGGLAKALGSSPRAVGQALRRNPFAPLVPCHRVVASTLELGGFNGCWGEDQPKVQQKKALLLKEGVLFQGLKIDPSCVVNGTDLQKVAK